MSTSYSGNAATGNATGSDGESQGPPSAEAVNEEDLRALGINWMQSVADVAHSSVPEPSGRETLGLILVAVLACRPFVESSDCMTDCRRGT